MTCENQKLIENTKDLVKRENEINAQIIRNLILIHEGKLHLEMGFGSLFDFCVIELGMSKASAQRRIDAVKLSQAVSDLPDRLESGAISLNRVGQVAQFLRQEKRIVDKTFTKKEVKELINEVQSQTKDIEVEKVLSQKSEVVSKPVLEKTRFVSGGRQTLEIEVDDEFWDLLDQVQKLISHKGYQTKADVLKITMKFYLQKNHPEHKAKKEKSDLQVAEIMETKLVPRGTKPKIKNVRYVPEKLKQLIWQKNNSCCSFIDPRTKRRCESKFRLQIEHIIPVAHGGLTIEENLTLLCQAHNLLMADKIGLLGKQYQQNLFA